MMALPTTDPPRIDLGSATGVDCAGCGEKRHVMVDGWCVSCILDEMGAGRGNTRHAAIQARKPVRFSTNRVGSCREEGEQPAPFPGPVHYHGRGCDGTGRSLIFCDTTHSFIQCAVTTHERN